MSNNKKYVWIGLVIIILIVLAGISFGDKSSDNSLQVTYTIGAPLPLTGKSASIGERVKTAMEIAVAEVNEQNNFDLKVIYDDDKGESPTALSVVQRLLEMDKVKVLIGLLKSDPLLAVAPITEKAKVIILSPTAGADAISQAGDFVFRNIEIPDAHGLGMTDFFKTKGVKKVALFTAQASNAKSYSAAFKKYFELGGGQIVSTVDYNPEATDFRTDIAKAKAMGAEAIYLGVATAKDSGILVKQIRESGFAGIIGASVATEAKEFLDIAQAAAEGVIITAAPFDTDNPKNLAFKEAFMARANGNPPDGFAANGYDAVKLIALALKSCKGDQDTACIRDYLYGVKNYDGIGGLTTFDPNGDVIKPVMIKTVREGKFVKY